MRACVTGATGFLGACLVARLAARGHAVTALVLPGDDTTRLAGYVDRVVRGDVAEPGVVDEAVAGADVVFHLAGLVPATARSRADLVRVNVHGARRVAEAAVRSRVARLVHCSSVGVYGVPPAGVVDERTPARPVNAYQASKLAGEQVATAAMRDGETSLVVARLTALYGPGDRGTLPLFRAVARGRVRIVGAGDVPCQLTHVDDAAALLCACADWDGDGSAVSTLVLGAAEVTTVRGLIELVADACGTVARPRVVPRLPLAAAWRVQRVLARRLLPLPGRFDGLDFFLADRTVDVSKARRALGMVARIGLGDGIREAVACARSAGLL